MKPVNKIIITNRSQEKMVLAVEPWADQYFIFPQESVDIVVSGEGSDALEIDFIESGIVIHGQDKNSFKVLKNGQEVPPGLQQ